MKACGIIVEYNPLHNGHVHHIKAAKQSSKADCIIAVMSGSFLQRGEPAIIDKFHRTKMALAAGVDIVVELPFPYAVQSSDLFSKGAIRTLHEIGASSICFGSESGNIIDFITSYDILKEKEDIYTIKLKKMIVEGLSFPKASMLAYKEIGLTTTEMDLSQPNNILGFSYLKMILDHHLPITPLTIKRKDSEYHDQIITSSISSATSIRQKLIRDRGMSTEVISTMPEESIKHLNTYLKTTEIMHTWESYFPLLHYRVMTMSHKELREINGINEGLEYRIKEKARDALTFQDLIKSIKTKRYTWTRLQRIFVYILTNTKKSDIDKITNEISVPYIRILGLTDKGRAYLKSQKKEISIPIITQLNRTQDPALTMEEKASDAFYSILPPLLRNKLRHQELSPPIMK